MTRHTNGEIIWTGHQSNQQTYPLNENGARYTISRFGGEWVILYLPLGTPQPNDGHEIVPWLPGRRSMTTAKQAAAAHHADKHT